VKHLHGIVATGKYAHQYDHHEPANCPSCGANEETNDHMIQCPAFSQHQWRRNTVQMIASEVTDSEVETQLSEILAHGLICAFDPDQPTLRAENYPEPYQQLIQAQNKLGWIHLFRCRWVQEWRLCYSALAKNHDGAPPAMSAQTWLVKKGKKILSQWWQLWDSRNKDRHQIDEERLKKNLKVTTKSRLMELYSMKTKIMLADRSIFPFDTGEEHLHSGQSLQSIYDWCLDNGPAIHASYTQAARLGVTGTGDIRSFIRQDYTQVDSATTREDGGPDA
jgi:predicted secreted protein